MDKNISEEVAAYWRGIELSVALEVFKIIPRGLVAYKSEFSDLEIDLSRSNPYALTRTPEGRRVDLSVIGWATHDTEGLDEFAGHLEWLKANNRRNIKYQIGYEREMSHQTPQIRYILVEYEDKVEERGF